jgi:multiple sugar transport system permease protein
MRSLEKKPVGGPVLEGAARYTRSHELRVRGLLYQRVGSGLTYAILIVAGFIILVPFFWLASASLKNGPQYFSVPIQWLAQPIHWENYTTIFTRYNFAHYVLNSTGLATYSVVAEVISSSLIAFGFARFRFPGRSYLFIIVLATMMLPAQVLTISLYDIYRKLGWIDTFLPLMVPKLFGSAFEIFLFRQFFLTLPRDLDDAARIDGCGSLGVYWHVILPQARPALIVAAIFSFLGSWSDVWGPVIYLSSNENRTIPVALFFFIDPNATNYPLLMAATMIALSVPVLLYAIGQRYIDSGIAIVEVK